MSSWFSGEQRNMHDGRCEDALPALHRDFSTCLQGCIRYQEDHLTPSLGAYAACNSHKNLLLTYAPAAVSAAAMPGQCSRQFFNTHFIIRRALGYVYMHIVHNQRILRRGAVRARARLSGAKSERAQRVACVAPIVSWKLHKKRGCRENGRCPGGRRAQSPAGV